jgi:hypothetical protein
LNSEGFFEPDITLNENDKKRVEITIKLYGLNDHSRPDERINELQKGNTNTTGIYRFLYF